jgi:hypothetical protein
MNTQTGYTTLEYNGEQIPFKFGTNAYALYCEMHGIDLYQIPETGLFGKTEGDKVLEAPSILRLRELFFCAYRAACLISGTEQKYNLYQVTECIEQSDITVLQDAMLKGSVIGAGRGNPQQPAV